MSLNASFRLFARFGGDADATHHGLSSEVLPCVSALQSAFRLRIILCQMDGKMSLCRTSKTFTACEHTSVHGCARRHYVPKTTKSFLAHTAGQRILVSRQPQSAGML